MEILNFSDCRGFDWDHANQNKNWIKHGVSWLECEQAFFNQPLLVHADEKHSAEEKRFFILGQTDQHRKLFIAFTIRNKLIRVISAREMSKKERVIYEKIESNPKI